MSSETDYYKAMYGDNTSDTSKGDKLANRRKIASKHAEGFYVGGRPIKQGKTKAQDRADEKEAWKNRKSDPNYKALTSGYMNKSVSGTGGLDKATRKTLAITEPTSGHNKGGMLGALKGLMGAKNFGAKKGAKAKSKALSKKQGHEIF